MTDRPILFSAPMVRAILDGSECACHEEQYFGVGKCWHCEAVEALAKHGGGHE